MQRAVSNGCWDDKINSSCGGWIKLETKKKTEKGKRKEKHENTTLKNPTPLEFFGFVPKKNKQIN